MNKLFLLLLLPLTAFADCPSLYPLSKTIEIHDTIELCNTNFVTRYNAKNKAAIFSSEILQPTGHKVVRTNNFHTDSRVTPKVYPHDYSNTGYDKGHLTPAGDSTTDSGMRETFLMTNMVPQLPTVNRVLINQLEAEVRKQASTMGPIHVLTGAIYGDDKKINGVPVPTMCYKVVYLPTGPKAYLTTNTLDATMKSVDIHELEMRIGFPLQ